MSSRNCHLNTRGLRTRATRYPPLKPGPGLSAGQVAAHQGKRLHQATLELVAAHGYEAVSVLELSNRARISKRDFYKLFTGKEECFLASYDTIVSRSVRGIVTAAGDEDGWRERFRLGFLAFAGQVVDSPATARLALVEAFTAGAVAVERTERTNVLFESLLAESFARTGDSPRLPPLVVKGVVAGVSRLTQARLLSDDLCRLSLDGNELLEWALSVCDGTAARLGRLDAEGVRRLPETAVAMPLKDERGLILAATAKLASEGGYATLTVPRVRAAAGVSRRSFDNHFESVTDCFLATLETLSDRTLAAAAPVYLSAGDWASGVHRMVARLCSCLARDPTFAGLAFLEAFSPCPEAIQWRGEMLTRLAARLRRDAPPPHKPGQLAAEASIGALWGVIHCFVAAGRGAQLPRAAPVLSYLALAPALGGAAAVEVIASESRLPR